MTRVTVRGTTINSALQHLVTMVMIEVIANDRLGKKVRVKCDSEDTVGDLKVCYVPLPF